MRGPCLGGLGFSFGHRQKVHLGRSWFGAATAAALLAAACGSSAASSSKTAPFTIGFAISETGSYQPFDVPAMQAAELAIRDINQSGGLLGRQLQVVQADNQSDPTQSANAGIKVLDAGAQMVVVTCDYDVGGPAAVQAQQRGFISWSTCAGSTLFGPKGVGPYAFTQGVPAITEGAATAEWAYQKGWRSAYVMADTSISYTNQLCQGFTERFQELAGQSAILGQATVKTFGQASYAAPVSAIRALPTPPAFIYECMVAAPGEPQLLKTIRSAGITTPIVGGQSLDGTFWQSVIPDLSNVYFTTHASIFGDDPSSAVNKLLAEYKQAYGMPMQASSNITGYMVIQAWADAVRKAGTFDAAKVASALESFKNEPTVLGPESFTPEVHIDFHRQVRIMQIQDGKDSFLTLWTVQKTPPLPPGA